MTFHRFLINVILIIGILGMFTGRVNGQEEPVLEDFTVYGGPGNQRGESITVRNGLAVIAGVDNAVNYNGVLTRFTLPSMVPDWSHAFSGMTFFQGSTDTPNGLYIAGAAYPPNCGASDNVGDTENKTTFFHVDHDGNLQTCNSPNYFPYRGWEYYWACAADEAGNVYMGGAGEERGHGGSRTVLAKYTAGGVLMWKRKFATDFSGNQIAGSTYWRINSRTYDLLWYNGHLYAVGLDRDGTNYNGQPPQGMLIKIGTQSDDPNPGADGAVILSPVWGKWTGFYAQFDGAVADGGYIYVAGHRKNTAAGDQYLIQKYAEDGTLAWTSENGGTGTDRFSGVCVVGGRFFAVGSTDSEGSGGLDVAVVEFDPASGAFISTQLFGGSQNDEAYDCAGEGTNLVVTGKSASFSQGGNAVGQEDALMLRYSVEPAIPPGPAIPVEERESLLDLYTALNGGAWTNNDGWGGVPGSEGDWYGVTTAPFGEEAGVVSVDLKFNNVTGSLPVVIADWPHLRFLNLKGNDITGGIPAWIGTMTELVQIDFTNNANLGGSIPAELGNLTGLKSLALSGCGLVGVIPAELNNMAGLEQLALANNNLFGEIPDLSDLDNLWNLNLGNNDLEGPLPDWIGDMSSLRELKLYSNSGLTGPVPVTILNLSELKTLDIRYTGLTLTQSLEDALTAAGVTIKK